MKSEDQRKIKAFERFGIVAASFFVTAYFLIQVLEPMVFGEKHPFVCWVGIILSAAFGAYNLYIVSKGSNT